VFGAILVALDHFHSPIVPLVSELHAEHNFESIGSHDWSSSTCENQCSAHIPKLPPRSICALNSKLRPTDKPFHFISPLPSSFPTSSAICCLISPLYSDFESDPLTYQDPDLIQDSSFAYACPRIRAKFFPKILFHLFIAFWAILALLEFFHSPIVAFLPELHADHNFEIIGNRNPSSSFDLILSEPRALDKPFDFISLPAFPFLAMPFFPLLISMFAVISRTNRQAIETQLLYKSRVLSAGVRESELIRTNSPSQPNLRSEFDPR
jgi:hypothetical protein